MTDTVVVEGQVRLREGKKWKSRWVVLRKPSPVADCLCVLVFKERSERNKGHRERSQVTLGDICGLELLQGYEGMNFALTLLCLTQTLTLAFDSRENLLAWDSRIRYSLGEVHRFSVNVQPGTKLESGPAVLHLCNNLLVLARDVPPAVMGHWRLSDLRRYGAVPNGFIFEGGTRCGYWTGVFFLGCTEGEQISFLFDCIARGISPNRTVFGLRPSLPDLSAQPSSAEDRITQEASELEKRLSMLSICSSRQSSSGDTRSISSSSSDTSHSDASLSSRLAIWTDPSRHSTPSDALLSPSGFMASRPSSQEHPGRGLRLPSKPPLPRGLQEAGRQSSTDSGFATGSHSSYSGSCSSYTSSLDATQGEIEEFGSATSLTLNPNTNSNTNLRLTPQPQNPQSSSVMARPCVCSVPGAPEGPESEYQIPSQIPQYYDCPRRLVPLQSFASAQKAECGVLETSGSPAAPKMTVPMTEYAVVPPAGVSMPRQNVCPVCGGLKVTSSAPTHLPPAAAAAAAGPDKAKPEMSRTLVPAAPDSLSVGLCTETDETSRYELMSSCTQQKWFWETEGRSSPMPTSPRSSLMLFRHPSLSGRSSVLAGESAGLQVDYVNYVNIPVSPVSKRQLNYMELDLQELQEAENTIRGSSSTKYAQIDITATETAQRVGAQHAQGREERLHQLEQKRRGNLN